MIGNSKQRKAGSKRRKIFVAMSGGVDSSVAALLLKKEEYDVTGVFMKCWSGGARFDKLRVNCAWERDSEDARRVAEKIGIPFYVWDFEEEYKQRVVKYMIDGYRRGLTPNPDVMCNREIKFGLFFDKARSMGADYIATGHYVRLRNTNEYEYTNSCGLFSARDKNKDQSYFLWILTQDQLTHCLFPIGDYVKPKVREIARKAGLPTAEKRDSQGICFLGKVTLRDFLKEYIPEKRGAVFSVAGERIGEHSGAQFYTIGQRHIAMANRKGQMANGQAVYVAEKNVKENTITVAEGNDHPALYKTEVKLVNLNFIDPKISSLIRANRRIRNKGIKVMARVRYRQPLAKARVMGHGSRVKIIFDEPQKFIASGQSAVFYDKKGWMLGGGVIV